MNKTAIVLIDTHGGYQNVNDWLYAKNPQKHEHSGRHHVPTPRLHSDLLGKSVRACVLRAV